MASDGVMASIMPCGIALSIPPGIQRPGNVRGMSNVGKNVRWFMREHDLREQAAAARLGVSQSTVNRLVNTNSSRPNRDPGQSTLQKIERSISVTAEVLAVEWGAP